jgi:hypothetical protein
MHYACPHLDLDTVAWEPEKIAVPREPQSAQADVVAFCEASPHWVVEGCYATLASIALRYSPQLILLHPGEAQCLANCRARPWESHKYASREAQEERLGFLLAWVSAYYSRDGDMSLSGHQALFDEYHGEKLELLQQPRLDPPPTALLDWLR